MMPAQPFAPPLPPPRSALPTLPFALDEYARMSCLPDGDDDLVFEASPPIGAITSRVPYLVAKLDVDRGRTRDEALMLSLIDGVSPVGILVQLVGTDADAAIVTVCDLYARGLVEFY